METFEAELSIFCILLQAYEGHGVDYGSLDVIDRHKYIGRCPYWREGLIEVGMALLEDVCYCQSGL